MQLKISLKIPQSQASVICTDFAKNTSMLTELASSGIVKRTTYAKSVANSLRSIACPFLVTFFGQAKNVTKI